MKRSAFGLTAAVLALSGLVMAGTAQAQTDGRWTPFLGCWEPAGGTSDGSVLCFQATADDTGVEMLTVADGEIVLTEVFRADGREQTIDREGCSGTETAEFSQDGRRIYTRSLYTCEGGTSRAATGIMSVISPNQWVDVRSIGVDGQQMAWAQFYQSATAVTVANLGLEDITANRGMAIRSARLAASAPIDVDDVLDAVAHVDAKTVEAWIAERGDEFDLSGEDLITLADAGLDEGVIDVMVAVSNPRYFQLQAPEEGVAVAEVPVNAATMRSAWNRYPYGRYYDPFFFDPFYYGLSRRYSYGYSPWGYGGYGGYSGYGWYGGYSPTPVVITPVQPSQGGGGRVVNGRGYRQGSSQPSSRSGAANRGAASRGSSGSSGGGAAATSTSSGSSSRGTSTGRTARRRGGGGF